ncbi:Hypothetical protein Tpal_468 [Trichococcus palustris]|uniref:Uncharacterized protein n=1 Tax=Trichococcus palustris TaxID=140314 RepID=A0A143Y7B3_9LACT|nr:hypothetical protein [Trichococcus palustris]CZQ83627.1 Hypothetical protein Tpal_468 [Trichococcus palustris]SFK70233.1 hypothetical protein SAMN04488076_103178 [Trichococcus palustris]
MGDTEKEMPTMESKDSIEGKKMNMNLKSGTVRFGQETDVRIVQRTADGLKIIPLVEEMEV